MNYQALANFRYEIRRFLRFSEEAARAAGLEPQQHQALLAIKGMPIGRIATVGAIAEHLHIQHHTAVELSDRLERNRLIARSRNRNDRREVLLKLTRHGEKLLQQLSAVHSAELRSAAPALLRTLRAVIHMDGLGSPRKYGRPAARLHRSAAGRKRKRRIR
jgi:DNA-binding MarR family transcriptional regulator